MPRIRLSWIVLAVAAMVTIASPSVRDILKLQRIAVRDFFLLRALEPNEAAWADAQLALRHYPKDPEMLLAAGTQLAEGQHDAASTKRAAQLVDQAAAAGLEAPAKAAIAVQRICAVKYLRLGAYGFDPEEPGLLEEMKKDLARRQESQYADPKAARAALEALRNWEKADPENGVPHALETYVLYGLHRDAEALACWHEAAELPTATTHEGLIGRARARLREQMGYPRLESSIGAYYQGSAFAALRWAQRIAMHEGHMAKLQGRSADAIALWNGTIAFGQHMQESAEDPMGFIVGASLEQIGASPTWKWVSEEPVEDASSSSVAEEKGRFWFGPQHEFYVAQVGEAADAALRERLVLGRQLTRVVSDINQLTLDLSGILDQRPVTSPLSAMGLISILSLLAFAVLSISGRRRADEATRPPRWLKPTAVVLIVGVLAVADLVVGDQDEVTLWLLFGAAVAVALFVIIAGLCALAVPPSRQQSARGLDAWRGNIRAALLPVAAGAALLYLVGMTQCARQRRLVENAMPPRDMPHIIQSLGNRWTHPTIPPDSWRAEYPPKK